MKKEDKQRAAWVDKQVLSRLWTNLLQKATYAFMDNDIRIWKRGIDIITSSLFKTEREKVMTYRESFENMDIEAYLQIQQFIIDLLEEKGYLKYRSGGNVEETYEGWGGETKESDDDE